MHRTRLVAPVWMLVGWALAAPLPPYRPTTEEVAAAYARADSLGGQAFSRAFKTALRPTWLAGGKRFWYRNDLPNGVREWKMVEAWTGKVAPAFDAAHLAARLGAATGKTFDSAKLPLERVEFILAGERVRFDAEGKSWEMPVPTGELKEIPARPRETPRPSRPWVQDLYPPDNGPARSPNGRYSARIDGAKVLLKEGDSEVALTEDGTPTSYYARLIWSPDSSRLLAIRVWPGDRKQVHLVESSPAGGGRAVLRSRVYDQPGDRVDRFEFAIFDPLARKPVAVGEPPTEYGAMPWPRWRPDRKRFTFETMHRGYSRWRVVEIDLATGGSRNLIDETSKTFIDSTAQFTWYASRSNEIVYRSERTGWGHLYLTNGEGGEARAITRGDWVVRSVLRVDEGARQIVFAASGMEPGLDPYFVRYYSVGFDGTGLTCLTPAPRHHSAQLSPDGRTMVVTASTVTEAPLHELRDTRSGKLLARLEEADISRLKEWGWKPPEPFVAKGRDGKTDIYGLVFRPRAFDPTKRYPVIEDIYAGPHDSFVPKGFSPHFWLQSVAELGFIVVQIDGMGTRNRGKAFHDVAWQNLKDSGFPDRIAWMRSVAEKVPQMDLDRVGVYGTSAGGQSSTAALLFHPEFYKVAVSSCGCHDNRMDKIWWNEQWMGYPVGPHYGANSNIDNAANLQGKLMLMVGELDTNVPPESTYRLVDALIRARKEFEFVLLPGLDHTGGGSYGERKRRDFFVRHLLGVEPPNPNVQVR